MDEVFSWFSSLWDSLVQQLLGLLPLSPFTGVIESLSGYPYLGYINWVFPVGPCLRILGLWLTAYTLYLFYSIIMRWLKVIGD